MCCRGTKQKQLCTKVRSLFRGHQSHTTSFWADLSRAVSAEQESVELQRSIDTADGAGFGFHLLDHLFGTNMPCGVRKNRSFHPSYHRPFCVDKVGSPVRKNIFILQRTTPVHNNPYICVRNAPRHLCRLFGRARSRSSATSTCRTPAFALLKKKSIPRSRGCSNIGQGPEWVVGFTQEK
jgi:hypothetical protein